MKKVYISTSSFAGYDKRPLQFLKDAGLEIVLNPFGRKMSEDEIMQALSDVDYLIGGTETLSRSVLESSKRLKAISRCGVGIDNINLEAAERLGIKIFNTPDAPTLAVAELTIGLILNLLRKVSWMDRELHSGHWEKRMGNFLYEKKVGIKGLGRIGQKVAGLLKPFGCEIAYSDPYVDDNMMGLKRLSLDDLLTWSDIITIHVPVKEQIIGERALRLMKKGAWLINTSRGEVIDEAVLYSLLKSGELSGAALDVYAKEPYAGPLAELDNVILTPHIGSYAIEARIEMEMQSVQNLLNGIGAGH